MINIDKIIDYIIDKKIEAATTGSNQDEIGPINQFIGQVDMAEQIIKHIRRVVRADNMKEVSNEN